MCYTHKEKFEDKYAKDKKYRKVRNRRLYTGGYRNAEHSICKLKYSVPEEILIAFHNGSNYNYNFIIKEKILKNNEKIFTGPIDKELRIEKKRKINPKNQILQATIY